MNSIIIPAFNESGAIKGIIESVKDISSEDDEIIVVDDGSTDDTALIVKALGVKLLSHPYNIGNGASVKTGLRAARGEKVILLDADGQHSPEDIPILLKQADRYDMVVGARSLKGQGARGMANYFYNMLATYVTGFKIADLTSGFRVIRRDVARKYIYLLPNRFSYPTTITLALLKSGHSVKYVSIEAKKRVGESKIQPLRDGFRFLLIIGKVATLYSPFKIFIPASALVFCGGMFYYSYAYITGTRFPNLPIIIIISGIIIFMMGLLAEQISQLRQDKTELD